MQQIGCCPLPAAPIEWQRDNVPRHFAHQGLLVGLKDAQAKPSHQQQLDSASFVGSAEANPASLPSLTWALLRQQRRLLRRSAPRLSRTSGTRLSSPVISLDTRVKPLLGCCWHSPACLPVLPWLLLGFILRSSAPWLSPTSSTRLSTPGIALDPRVKPLLGCSWRSLVLALGCTVLAGSRSTPTCLPVSPQAVP